MRCHYPIAFLVALSMTSISAPLNAQSSVPPDLNQFGLICFCSSRVATPHHPVGLDNNGRVLFAARTGATKQQLQNAGISITDSQLRMLRDRGLLESSKGVFTTAFPILDPPRMAALRDRLSAEKRRVLPLIGGDVRAISQELRRHGFEQSEYSVLFAYVLDGLVWQKLEPSRKLPSQEITAERPFWAGTFWAVYPSQKDSPGTNSRNVGRASIRSMWNPKVLERVNALNNSERTATWLRSLAEGRATSLYEGSPQPLVIREDRNDPLFVHGSNIAGRVAEAMLRLDLAPVLPEADESQRLLIGTHEFIWLLLAEISQTHGVRPPAILTSGAASDSELAPVVMGVVSARNKP